MSALGASKVGCIGTGNMGGAIVSGLARVIDPAGVICFDEDSRKAQELRVRTGVTAADSAAEVCETSDIVILAVKPDVTGKLIETVKKQLDGKLIISIAAGISIDSIQARFSGPQRIVRVMPNTPALIGEGMSVLSPGGGVDEKSLAVAEQIFAILGRTAVLPEKMMDAVTALSGCGPAYVYTMLQAMADGGVKMGIPRDKALLLAAQTMLGSVKMVLAGGEDPITLRGRVTSPGGSTIDAVHVLERAGFSGIIMDAVETAALKSARLGGLGK
jgi:pyrroline-5-carboxylate reductase